MKFQKPKGTRDFYPDEFAERQEVFNSLKTIVKRYGFSEIEAPAIEDFNLIKAKSGEEIKQQIFMLEKRGNEQLALRAELTPSFARMFIEKQKQLTKPVKWFTISRMWRYEAPQKGRAREFYQLNVEIFGSEKPSADAELISLAIDCLLELGLKAKDFVIKINNRKLLEGLLKELKIKNIEETLRVIDKVNKITEKEFDEELNKLKLNNKQKIKEIIKITNLKDIKTKNPEALEGLEELKEVFKILKQYNKDKFIKFDLSTARGLSYYTGTVFECYDKEEKLRSILGGGRYDDMIKQFGGESCPATGFAMGDITTEFLLKNKNLWPKADISVDYYIAPVNEAVRKDAIEIASNLRKKFKVEIDLMSRKLSKQFEYADSIKAKKVIIVGETDLKNKQVTIREMKTGKEEKVKIKSL